VWGSLRDNPYHEATIGIARRYAAAGTANALPPEIAAMVGGGTVRTGPPTEIERAFSVRDPAVWPKAIEEAGFKTATVTPVLGARRFGSAEAALAAMKDSPIHREPIDRLPPAQQEAAWADLAFVCDITGGTFRTMHLVLHGWKLGRLQD